MDLLDEELDNPIPYQPYSYYCVLVSAIISCAINEAIEVPLVINFVIRRYLKFLTRKIRTSRPAVKKMTELFRTKLLNFQLY
jgi:cobalamin biosynthesis protein CobD/CbiB